MTTLYTPNMNLPYPDGAERVMDGDNAIGALASAVDGPLYAQHAPAGIIVSGPARTLAAASEKLPLASIVGAGSPGFFDDANDQIVIPVGWSGLYHVWYWASFTLPTAAGQARLSIRAGAGTQVQTGSTVYSANGPTAYAAASAYLQLASGQDLQVHGEGTAGNLPTITVQRFGLTRIGQAFRTSALGLLSDDAPDGDDAPAPPRRRR